MKVLIISHNPLSTYNNMGKTMLSLFDSFSRDELCQLYIHISVPDTDKCHSYYRITDKDVLRSYLKFRVDGGEISPEPDNHTMFSNERDEKLYSAPGNRRPFRMLARDAMWKMSRWYNDDLKEWLERENPDRIFVAHGSSKFIYDITLKIARERNIPIIAYSCDDYYFVKKADSLLGRIQQKALRSRMDALLGKAARVITICDELSALYAEKFGVPAETVMTGSCCSVADKVSVCEDPTSITYIGNIGCGRYFSIIEIGRALDGINSLCDTDYTLKVYSAEKNRDILAHFDDIRSVRFCGYVSGSEFDEALHSAQILLHTEAFDEDSIDRVKHSVSTKIAESLASGIPLFAYGPPQVASIRHLIRNDCAVVATSQSELIQALRLLFADSSLRRRAAEHGLEAARKFHNTPVQSRRMYDLLKNL